MSWETVQGAIPPKKVTHTGQYMALCPAHEDHNPSLSVTLGDSGNVLVNCLAGCSVEAVVAAVGLKMSDLMADDSGRRPKKTKKKQQGQKDDPGVLVDPVPEGAPPPPRGSGGSWDYRDADGNLKFVVNRENLPGGGKTMWPVTYRDKNGRREWKSKAIPDNRPPYQADKLAADPDAVVVILEGEKATDAAERLGVKGYAFTTSSGGCKAAEKTDWSLCSGRRVVIFPDCDAPGRHYAADVRRLAMAAGAASVTVLDTASIFGKEDGSGWDIADADEEEGRQFRDILTAGQFEQYESSAPEAEGDAEEEGGRRKPTVADRIVEIGSGAELFHDKNEDCFASIQVEGHVETYPINGSDFRGHLSRAYFLEYKTCPNAQAMQDAERVLLGKAKFEGEEREVHFRLGGDGENVFLDLCNGRWEFVRIGRDGWKVVPQDSDVRFVRRKGQQALPTPERGGTLDLLRRFVNVSAAGFVLLVAWLVSAMQPGGPYLILAVGGEHGSGKSTVTKLLKMILDPVAAALRSIPGDERDLAIAAKNSFVLAFDNLSGICARIADALCRIVFGHGFCTRQLFSDDEEKRFHGARPVIINGIEDLLTRPDLADRAETVLCKEIPATERRTEKAFWSEFERLHPLILGALCDAVATGLRRFDETILPEMPRMADAAKWVSACEPALPWAEGEFMRAYNANVASVQDVALEADLFATSLLQVLENGQMAGEVTATEIRETVGKVVPDDLKRSDSWPKTPRALVGRLRRILPLLRSKNWVYSEAGKCQRRRVTLYAFRKTKVEGDNPSHPSHPSHIPANAANPEIYIARDREGYCEGLEKIPHNPSHNPSHASSLISDGRGVRGVARGTEPVLSLLDDPSSITAEERAKWQESGRTQ